MEARYDLLHRASSPSVAPSIVRSHCPRPHNYRIPPLLPDKSTRQSSSVASNPPVPPPISAPRPPKGSKDNYKQDHIYENTIIIPGTKQHVVKNINSQVCKMKFFI